MASTTLPAPAAASRGWKWRSLEFVLGALLTGVMVALVLLSVWIFPDRGSAMDLAARLSPPFAQWAIRWAPIRSAVTCWRGCWWAAASR